MPVAVKFSEKFYKRFGHELTDELVSYLNQIDAGYRSERTTIEASNTDTVTPANNFKDREKTYKAEAYEAGLTLLVGKRSKIFTKYATIYRIPFLDEVASFNGFGPPLFLQDLEKEKGNYEQQG